MGIFFEILILLFLQYILTSCTMALDKTLSFLFFKRIVPEPFYAAKEIFI
jgi:hypothetical protein